MSTATKVFVGNLAYSTTEEDLLDAFGKCGKVTEAKVVRRGNRSKGYGFVDFEEENDAQKSVEALDKVELNGRSINVQLSTSTNTGEEGDGDSQVRRRDKNDDRNDDRPRYNNNNNYRRNNNNYGGGRYNNNNSSFRRNNWNNRDDNRDNNRDNNRGNRDNRDNNRDNRDNNRDNNRGSPSGRRTYSLRKNENTENKRRYTPSNAKKVESRTIVFVANLPYSYYDEDLVDLFKKCGDIKTAHVVRTRGKSKGYGFVEFQSHEGQVAALEKMDNLTVENSRGEERPLSVKIAMQEGGESEQGSGNEKDNDNEGDNEGDDEGEKNDD